MPKNKKSELSFMDKLKSIKKTNPKWFLTFFDEENIYTAFIENCRSKTYLVNPDDPLTAIHSHHILPKHLLKDTDEEQIYCNSSENLIDLSISDHIRAHELFLQLYPSPQNQSSVYALQKAITQALSWYKKAGAYASHSVQRERKIGIFNPDFAAEIAKKGAEASLARPDARETRQAGGKKGGVNRYKGIVVGAGDKIVWYYNPERVGSGTQETDRGEAVCCTFDCETGGQIVEILNSIHPSNLQRISAVLNGTRKSSHGWSCERIYPSEDSDDESQFDETQFDESLFDEFGSFDFDLVDEPDEKDEPDEIEENKEFSDQ